MKKLSVCISVVAFALILGSCNGNEKPAEVKQEELTVPATQESAEPAKDTAKTSISVGPGGASVKTKEGTNVSVGSEGATVGTKDVKVDIKTK